MAAYAMNRSGDRRDCSHLVDPPRPLPYGQPDTERRVGSRRAGHPGLCSRPNAAQFALRRGETGRLAIWGLQVAIWFSLGLAIVIAITRLFRRQSLLYALGGAGGVALASAAAYLLGRTEGFFLPTIIASAATVLLCLVSVLVGRPIVASTSFVARRWPVSWYWHPKLRPAYSEVTWMWVVFFGLRLLLQINLFRAEAASLLGIAQLLTGWPATILLLIASYLYGTWRLRNLGGPSVEEFRSGTEPPWRGQRRGF